MKYIYSDIKYILLLGGISLIFVYLYFQNIGNGYLTFSDGVKFADIARNLNLGLGYGNKFSFWSNNFSEFISKPIFSSVGVPPLMPFSISLMFRFLGVNDLVVIATSTIYFVLLVIAVFLFGQKMFGKLVGVLASLAVSTNINFIEYAKSGASEPLLALEIVLSAYFIILKKKLTTVLAFVVMALMYFTRPQAFIYITGLILYWLLTRFEIRKAILIFGIVLVFAVGIDRFVLLPLHGKYFLYSVTFRGIYSLTQGNQIASTNTLRGVVNSEAGSIFELFKKLFYNLYNFYKLLPQITSPYMWSLFAIGLFKFGKNKVENSFKISSFFMVILTFVVAAFTIPFFRYIQPIIPLVLLIAIETMVWIIRKTSDLLEERIKWIAKKHIVEVISSFLVFFFVIGQTLGVIFLDSRFEEKRVNKGKPPVYVIFSIFLKENTKQNDVIITNLDTWGSWYGERKTVWFPLKPDMLIPPKDKNNPFDAIYLTSYLIDDENYYMGSEWRQIFKDPLNIQDSFIAKNYIFVKEFKIDPSENYEKMDGRAILLVRKSN